MICRKCKAEVPDGAFCLSCGARQDVERKPKTRGNGTGSVYQLPNKKWIAIKTTLFIGPDGKKHKKTVSNSTFKTKKDAVNALPLLGTQKKKAAGGVTFSKVYESWLPQHKAGRDTLNCYKSAYKYFDDLYAVPFEDVTVDDLQECINDCPHGKRTRQNMKTLVGLLYKYAIPRNMATINMGDYLTIRVVGTGWYCAISGKLLLPYMAADFPVCHGERLKDG